MLLDKEEAETLEEGEVKLRSHWGGKRESVLDRLQAKSLVEDSGNSKNLV